MKYLTEDPLATDTTAYDDWVVSECSVITWLLSSMDEEVSASVMFLKTAKETWDTLKEMYSNQQNNSRVADMYESYSHCNRKVTLYLTTTLS